MNIKITADNIEVFNFVENHFKSLPDEIRVQIEKGESGLGGFDYTIKERFGVDEPIVYVPKNVKQIKTFPSQIVIYCDGYILRINESMMKSKLHYVFVNPNKNTDGHP